jgi:hypothetical protein
VIEHFVDVVRHQSMIGVRREYELTNCYSLI